MFVFDHSVKFLVDVLEDAGVEFALGVGVTHRCLFIYNSN